MNVIYGIGSCDSCRKARKWLDQAGIEYKFHDLRSDGLDLKLLRRWSKQLAWDVLLNKRSLTWRKIPEADRARMNNDRALMTMLDYPTLIKRPVLEAGTTLAIGFEPDQYAKIFAGRTKVK